MVTLLAVTFLLLSLAGWVRLEQAIQNAALITQYAAAGLPFYLAMSGLVWGIVGLPAVWALWSGARWVAPATWIPAVGYLVLYWVNWFFGIRAPESRENWPFTAGLGAAWLLLVWLVLNRRSTLNFIHNTIDHGVKS